MGGSFFRAQKEDLAYETYNQGSYPASPLRKPLPSRKAGIICCIKTYPVFLSKEGLFNFITGHRCVKNDLADHFTLGTNTGTSEHSAVFQYKVCFHRGNTCPFLCCVGGDLQASLTSDCASKCVRCYRPQPKLIAL